jgi:hypothetical protein
MDHSPRTPSNRARALLAAVGRDAAFDWRLPPAAALAGLVAPWAGAAIVAAARADASLFPVVSSNASEWVATAAWLAATLLAGGATRQLWLARRTREAWVFGALTVLCCLAAGRATSWGVDVLGKDTPSGLIALHRQGSLAAVAALLPALFAVVGCYGAAAPWVATARARIALAVPPLFLSSSFLLLTGYEALRLVVHSRTLDAFGLWPELCFAAAVGTFARLAQQRVRRACTPVLPALGVA